MNYGTGKLTTILWIRFERKFRSEWLVVTVP
jgi:hypothetical protein